MSNYDTPTTRKRTVSLRKIRFDTESGGHYKGASDLMTSMSLASKTYSFRARSSVGRASDF